MTQLFLKLLGARIEDAVNIARASLAFRGGIGAGWIIFLALIYWWQDENELHSRIYAGAEIDGLEPAPETALGCVWELGIVEFERRAWIEDVIGNPDGPDLTAYLGRRFDGMI